MANEYYRGPSRTERIGQSLQSSRSPDLSQAARGNDRRAASIAAGVDALIGAAKGAISSYAKVKTKEAAEAGTTAAMSGGERGEADFWSGDARQEAYDTVRAENDTRSLPSFVEQHMASDKTITKPIDELTDEERQAAVFRARDAFFEQPQWKDAPHRQKAMLYANELVGKQLDYLQRKSVEIRNAKAESNISTAAMNAVNEWQGNPEDVDAQIEANMLKWQQSYGDKAGGQTREAVMTGLLQSVMSDKPNLNTLAYLKSPQAKARFGHLEGFDRAVDNADKFALKAQNAEKLLMKSKAENDFYGVLNAGGFSSIEAAQASLNQYPDSILDQSDKYTLLSKARKHLKDIESANVLQDAIAQKNFGVVNAAKQDDLLIAFERNVMPKSVDIDVALSGVDEETAMTQNAFTKWIKDGYNVPNHVKEHLNSPINAGNSSAWNQRLATYQRLSQRLGPTGISKLYESETQASLEEYASLSADTTLKPEDRKQAIINFMEGAKADRITGLSVNATIRNELMNEDTGLVKDLQDFAAEGGGDTTFDMSVPDDLQPFSTVRSNSDTAIGGYAMKSLMGNYSIYRRQNPSADPEVALRKAKNDFLNQNLWVDWEAKSTYVPREYGTDFAKRGMEYIKDSGIIDRLALTEGLPPEAIESKVTIEPSSDYHTSRKLSVYYDGIEQDHKFTFKQFDRKIKLLSEQERRRIEQENAELRNSKEYKERHQKMKAFREALDSFGMFKD